MAKKDKRFIRTHGESGLHGSNEIWVDRETGVNYLYHTAGYGGGLTPLLDRQGQVVVTTTIDLEED